MKIRSSKSAGCRATLPIHSVSLLTNLSVDTIRAWEKRYGAIADAARQTQVGLSWDRAMVNAQRPSNAGVKLHPGWDAAFRRARAN